MKVPEKIQRAFIKFIFRGGYKVKPTPQGVQYYKVKMMLMPFLHETSMKVRWRDGYSK